jgi:2-C-methyl-D-erythritol 4-phosphate cytidylyltransferase
MILVTREEHISLCRDEIVSKYGLKKVVKIIVGGAERQDSVYNGLRQLPEATSVVVIHDGARPLVTSDLVTRSVAALPGWDGAVVAVPVPDTLKEIEAGYRISRTLERQKIFAAQTPQTFRSEVLKSAYERAMLKGFYGTDDAALVERAGFRVRVVEGSPENIKVTTPVDLLIAEAILQSRLKRQTEE